MLPSVIDKITNRKQLLDYLNITVARVNGKGSFLIYVKMLQCFNIPFVILSDLDCFADEVSKFTDYLKLDTIKSEVERIKRAFASMPVDYDRIKDRVKCRLPLL